MYRLDNDKENAIYTWVDTYLTACSTVWVNQNAPQPDRPYTTLELFAPDIEGTPPLVYDTATSTHYREIKYKIRLSVNIYAFEQHLNLAQKLINSQYKEGTRTILSAQGLVIRTNEPPNDLSSLLDTKFEGRAQVDFWLGYHENDYEDIGYISTVVYSAAYTTETSAIITFSASVTYP